MADRASMTHWFVVLFGLPTFCVVVYLAMSLPAPAEPRDGVVSEVSGSGESHADLEELVRAQTNEIQALREGMEQWRTSFEARFEVLESEIAGSPGGSGRTRVARSNADSVDAALTQLASNDAATTDLAERLSEGVESRLGETLEKLAARQRNRNEAGEWKAPFAELSQELDLTEEQEAIANEVFDVGHDEVFALLKTPRADGGNLLDDLVEGLRKGDDDAYASFMRRIYTEKIPNSDRTYLSEFVSMSERVRGNLTEHLNVGQLDKLDSLNVSLLEVTTGYDPTGEYIRTQLSQ